MRVRLEVSVLVLVGCAAGTPAPPPGPPDLSPTAVAERMRSAGWAAREQMPDSPAAYQLEGDIEACATLRESFPDTIKACRNVASEVASRGNPDAAVDFYRHGCLYRALIKQPIQNTLDENEDEACAGYFRTRNVNPPSSSWRPQMAQDIGVICPGAGGARVFPHNGPIMCGELAAWLEKYAPAETVAIRAAHTTSCEAGGLSSCDVLRERFGEQRDERADIARAQAWGQGEWDKSNAETLAAQRQQALEDQPQGASAATQAPADASPQPAAAGCAGCSSSCSLLQTSCAQGGQVACYQAAACLCSCNLANGGCGSSTQQLAQCVADNQASAQQLSSGGTAVVAGPAPSPPPAPAAPPPAGGTGHSKGSVVPAW